MLNNWNNKPARGFPAADDQWAYGSLNRVDLLNDNTARVKRHTLATLTGAMNAAATQDVRVMKFVPVLARLLKGGTPPSARASQMLALLEAWRAKGGSRLDRDLDGKIDDPGAAILDAAWNRLADAAMTPVLGEAARGSAVGHAAPAASTCRPAASSAAGTSTWTRTCARLMGEKVKGPFANRYCGGGRHLGVPRGAVGGARGGRRGARGGAGAGPERVAR